MEPSLIENQINISGLDKYAAIIGKCPSKGARSPLLWNAVFEHTQNNCKMLPLDVKEKNIIPLLDYLNSEKDFIGGAVTVPYKEVVAKWLENNITDEAKQIGAVNCLFRNSDGLLFGTNTDGEAALLTYKNHYGSLAKKSVMILGCGGAGKALASFFSSSSKSTLIISRSKSDESYAKKIHADWASWDDMDKYILDIDIIINCTSIGFGDQVLNSPLSEAQILKMKKSGVIFDIIYQPLKSELLKRAKKIGISTLNGLTMNLEQAVLAFAYCSKEKSLDKIKIIMGKVT